VTQPPYQPEQQYFNQQYYAPPEVPKKNKTGIVVLVVTIVVVVLAVLVTAGVLLTKSVVGNSLSPYCRAASSAASQLEDLNNQLTTASTTFDMETMSDVMGKMVTILDEMRAASPPDSVAPSLDIVVNYLSRVKTYIDTRDLLGYISYSAHTNPQDVKDAINTIQTASIAYCT